MAINLFHEIEEGVVILRQNGKYTQSRLYVRDGYLYAAVGKAFVKLHQYMKGTSCPSVSWEEYELPPGYSAEFDKGYIVVHINQTGA